MPHFYVNPENIRNGRFALSKEESRHIAAVLRKNPGDPLHLFDGLGKSYRAQIETVTPQRVEGRILAEEQAKDVPYFLRLFQGLPKGDKFEWILEKVTELGAGEIVPVYVARGDVKVPAEKIAARVARWEKVLLAAAKQCGRAVVPKVRAPLKWAEALTLCRPEHLTLLPWEGESGLNFKDALSARRPGKPEVNVFIGPEGGFTPEEVEAARKQGAVVVTLGPAVLRTETAAMYVAAVLLHEWGNL